MDPEQEMAALAEHSGRAAGTDAERRAARHLQGRLRALGREAELQPIEIRPRAELAHALHALLAVAGSLTAVENAALGASLVLAAGALTVLDLTGVLRLTRRVTGRRASQNVFSPEGGRKPGVIVVVAGYDARRAAAGHDRLPRPLRDPWEVMLGSTLLLLGCCAARLAGIEGTALAALQFVPTAVLVAVAAVLLGRQLAEPANGGNDAGVVTALWLGERLGGTLEHFDLWVLLTGAQRPFALGMSDWLRRHRSQTRSRRTLIVGLHDLARDELRFARRHGALLPLRADPRLLQICRAIVEDGARASDGVVREPVDAAAASARGLPAITLTSSGRDPGADPLERSSVFCRELIERIDAELGPALLRS